MEFRPRWKSGYSDRTLERQAAVIRQYLSDMRKLLAEIQRILKPKGLAALVVGPTMLNAKIGCGNGVWPACPGGRSPIGREHDSDIGRYEAIAPRSAAGRSPERLGKTHDGRGGPSSAEGVEAKHVA